jgi:HSP20 family protein
MPVMQRRYRFPEVSPFRSAMERFFDEPFVRPAEWFTLGVDGILMPPVDAYATKEAFIVKIALPGVAPEAVETTIEGDTLTIHGTYPTYIDKEEVGYLFQELPRGEFRRSLVLPVGLKIDAVEATFEYGLLTVLIPKVEEVKPRLITVKAR